MRSISKHYRLSKETYHDIISLFDGALESLATLLLPFVDSGHTLLARRAAVAIVRVVEASNAFASCDTTYVNRNLYFLAKNSDVGL